MSKFVCEKENHMENTSFNVPSITCSVCANKIRTGLGQMQGIGNISMDLKSQQVTVDFDETKVKQSDITGKVSSLGYELIQ